MVAYGHLTAEETEAASVDDLIKEHLHEDVKFHNDPESGLNSIIAVHSTKLGPALGGTRMWNYKSEREALIDVLRLSRGMTYKASIIGLPLGGGKAVIIGDPRKDKSEALWREYGKFIESLGGRYISAEDVGTTLADMEIVAKETKYVTGLPENMGGSGDPSPFTAYGVYLGMKASAKYLWGSDVLSGKSVIIQGAGNVGRNLIKHLSEEGAKIYVTDIYEDKCIDVANSYDVSVVDADKIFDQEVDIYAPCALGATLNNTSITQLKCKIVAGGANNQLADEVTHAQLLSDKGILYAPDFLINAGGLVNVYMQLETYDRNKVLKHTEKIYDLILQVLNTASESNITTQAAALMIAEDRINNAN